MLSFTQVSLHLTGPLLIPDLGLEQSTIPPLKNMCVYVGGTTPRFLGQARGPCTTAFSLPASAAPTD